MRFINKFFTLFLTILLLIHSCAIGILNDDILCSAYEKGWALLQSAAEGRDVSRLYVEEKKYLNEFPFHAYTSYAVAEQGEFYLDNDRGDCIKDFLRKGIPWEKELIPVIRQYISPDSIAIDIGGHIGTHSMTMSRCVGKGGRVVVFEPNKKIFRELCMNLSLNGCDNVIPVRCALGKEAAVMNMIQPLGDNEGATFVTSCLNGEKVLVLPLDSFHLKGVSFIKIDAENMEGEILDGAIETIQSNHPAVLIEIQGNSLRSNLLGENSYKKSQEIMNKLISLGYEMHYLGFVDYLGLFIGHFQ